MNAILARIVYFVLAASIYLVSLMACVAFFVQPERYLTWWAVLLSGPIFMSCLLSFSLVITWLGQYGNDDAESSLLRRWSHWYHVVCTELNIEFAIGYMCAWLSHLHFVTGSMCAFISFIAYLADLNGPYLEISGLLVLYLFIVLLFSGIRRNCAPQPGLDYRT